MTLNRRSLLVTGGAVLSGAALSSAAGAQTAPGATDGSKSAALFLKDDDGLAPASFDRLPLEFHQARAKALQAHLVENGFAGAWLSDPMNIIYFTGLYFTTTERPFSVFLPADRLATIWFNPGLDRDLVKTWWATESDYYFDFQHADGGFPNEGKVQQGAKVDLFEWVLKGLKKRGYDGKRIATDKDLSAKQLSKAGTVFLKETKFDSVSEHCEKLRMVKSPEELALWRRAYRVFDETHAFARDLLLAKGTDLTDYELAMTAQEFGMGRLMSGIKRDGRPHSAVGIELGIGVRCGVGTAYPHPNQMHYNKIQKGQALQIAGRRRDRRLRRRALSGVPARALDRPPEESLDRRAGLLPHAEGPLPRRRRLLDRRLPDPPAPGEGRDEGLHLPPPGARHGHGRPPAAVPGAGRLHDARGRDDLLRRAGSVRSAERLRSQLLRRLRRAVGQQAFASDVAASVVRGVVPREAVETSQARDRTQSST